MRATTRSTRAPAPRNSARILLGLGGECSHQPCSLTRHNSRSWAASRAMAWISVVKGDPIPGPSCRADPVTSLGRAQLVRLWLGRGSVRRASSCSLGGGGPAGRGHRASPGTCGRALARPQQPRHRQGCGHGRGSPVPSAPRGTSMVRPRPQACSESASASTSRPKCAGKRDRPRRQCEPGCQRACRSGGTWSAAPYAGGPTAPRPPSRRDCFRKPVLCWPLVGGCSVLIRSRVIVPRQTVRRTDRALPQCPSASPDTRCAVWRDLSGGRVCGRKRDIDGGAFQPPEDWSPRHGSSQAPSCTTPSHRCSGSQWIT